MTLVKFALGEDNRDETLQDDQLSKAIDPDDQDRTYTNVNIRTSNCTGSSVSSQGTD